MVGANYIENDNYIKIAPFLYGSITLQN